MREATNFLFLLVPMQLLRQQFNDRGQRFLGGGDVQERETSTSREHVHGRARVLLHRVGDFRFDVRELRVQPFAHHWPALARQRGQVRDLMRLIAVRMGQVQRYLESISMHGQINERFGGSSLRCRDRSLERDGCTKLASMFRHR